MATTEKTMTAAGAAAANPYQEQFLMCRRRVSRPASRERTSGAWTSSTGWRA